jgi:hypothetical protein
MSTNTSWSKIAEELTPILDKTEFTKKDKKKKNFILLLALGIGATVLWFMGAYWVYKWITG